MRLNTVRQESASCTEMVLLPAFGKSARLPEGRSCRWSFCRRNPGELEFGSQMGIIRGTVIVE